MLAEKELIVHEQHFVLTNLRAFFWREASAIVLSDLHLGKTAHFRKNGIALPSQLLHQDLERLSQLVEHYQPRQIIVVGDFLHAGKNSDLELFKDWRAKFSDVLLRVVKGNHDRMAPSVFHQLSVDEVCDVYEENGMVFSHEEIANSEKFVVSGHYHPGIQLKTSVKGIQKFPCFMVTQRQLILPAFSSFSGLDTRNHPAHARYYFFTHEGIYEI